MSSTEPTPPSPTPAPRRPRAPRGPQLRTYARFHSKLFRNCRDVTVWTPPGYGAIRGRRHPVIYFQDGQTVFADPKAPTQPSWHAGQCAAKLLARREIAPPILVAIGHAGDHRIDEYTPTRADYVRADGTTARSAGDGKRYARFVVNELKPFIDARYLTLPGPRTTALVGAGHGALAALYLALWHPRVFGQVAALSPTLDWDNRAALRDFGSLKRPLDFRIWLDTGTAEAGWETVPLFRDALIGAGWALGATLTYREAAGAQATEAAWAARLPDVLRFLVSRGR